jgi:hypothetical protein
LRARDKVVNVLNGAAQMMSGFVARDGKTGEFNSRVVAVSI